MSCGLLNSLLPRLGLGLLFCTVCGCGSSDDDELAKVTGKVTFLGQPAQAEITFKPITTSETGSPSSALTDENGEFKLRYTLDQEGATVGEHQVTIKVLSQTLRGEPKTFQEATEPVKVAHFTRTVESGKNTFLFTITP